jgi:hypothetical protein
MLTRRAEEVLRTIHFYRYMTAQDVTYALFSPSSLRYVRKMLADLCGGEDFQPNQYLYRFPLPLTTTGEKTRIFTLGALGREIVAKEMGIPVDWYFKPQKTRHLSFGFLSHALMLTRILVAAHYFVKTHPELKIARLLTSYELEKTSLRHKAMVIPDAWILFQGRERQTPILLEIDRGSEHKQQFKAHVKARIEFIRSGAYRDIFKEEAILIAYATTGQLPEYRESRRNSMCRWTLELLEELRLPAWSPVFRFASVDWDKLYETRLFDSPVWFEPDKNKPVKLL